MTRPFVRAKPLQALKLGATVGLVGFAVAGFAGLLPGQELTGLLLLAFLPVLLALVIAGEALVTLTRLLRADDPIARLTARPAYTAVRAIELGVAVVAPVTFYVLVVEIGGELAGPGAVGLLFVGIAAGLLALAAVLLRTLFEYYRHRRRRSSTDPVPTGNDVAE